MCFSLQSNKRCMVVLVIKFPISIPSFLGGISKQFLKHLVCFQCQRRVTHGGRTINVKYWVSREGRPSQTTQTLRRKTNDTKWCILQKNQVMCSVFWRRKCKMKGFKGYEWKESKIWPIHLELKKGKYDEICNSLQSHKGTSGHLTFRGNFWKWMNRRTKLKRSTLKPNQETGWKQWAVLKLLPMYRQALANIMKCLHLKST